MAGDLEGLCHLFIHADADVQKAVDIAVNAKMRRTGICGAAETLLVDRAVAETMLPVLALTLPRRMEVDCRFSAGFCATVSGAGASAGAPALF